MVIPVELCWRPLSPAVSSSRSSRRVRVHLCRILVWSLTTGCCRCYPVHVALEARVLAVGQGDYLEPVRRPLPDGRQQHEAINADEGWALQGPCPCVNLQSTVHSSPFPLDSKKTGRDGAK